MGIPESREGDPLTPAQPPVAQPLPVCQRCLLPVSTGTPLPPPLSHQYHHQQS